MESVPIRQTTTPTPLCLFCTCITENTGNPFSSKNLLREVGIQSELPPNIEYIFFFSQHHLLFREAIRRKKVNLGNSDVRYWRYQQPQPVTSNHQPKCISSTVHQNQILKTAKFFKKSLGTLKYRGILAIKKKLSHNSKFWTLLRAAPGFF